MDSREVVFCRRECPAGGGHNNTAQSVAPRGGVLGIYGRDGYSGSWMPNAAARARKSASSVTP